MSSSQHLTGASVEECKSLRSVDRKSFKNPNKRKQEIVKHVQEKLSSFAALYVETSPFYDVLFLGETVNALSRKTNPELQGSIRELLAKGEEKLLSLYKDLHYRYVENISTLCFLDKSIECGVVGFDERREECINNFRDIIRFFNLDIQVRTLSKLHLLPLGKVSHARLLHQCYYESNELHSSSGTLLSKMCFENLEYANLLEMFKIEPNYKCLQSPPLIQHFGSLDRAELKTLLETGEPFFVYRGFLIDEDDYVRKGRRIDGSDYYKQSAGMGVSYSLREDVAYYFCYWGLFFGLTSETEVKKSARESIEDPLESVPFPLWTEEEFIDYHSRLISRKIDASRKKPIVCKFLVDPRDIKGFNFIKGESEINLLPEDLVVERYTIASSRDIAVNLHSCKRRSVRKLEEFQGCYKDDGVVLWMTSLGGKKFYIYADASRVNAEITVLKNELMQSGERYSHDMLTKIRDLFLDAAVEVPSGIDPALPTREWIEFIQGESTNLQPKKGTWYPAE